ncbi:MAG: hypothetical protein ACREEE_00745 [Dongiaceae bacterium]
MPSTFPLAVPTPTTVDQLVQRIDALRATVSGDPLTKILSVASPSEAEPGSLVFVEGNLSQAEQCVRSSRASTFVIENQLPNVDSRCFIKTSDPRAWYIAALRVMFPQTEEGHISVDARVSDQARLGKNVLIGPFSVIAAKVVIGDDTRIGSHVVVHEGSVIGSRCIIKDHTTIGGTGMAYHRGKDSKFHFFPHMGCVRIGDDVEIAAGCCIVRGMMNDTIVGNGTKIGNYVNIGHNSVIGEGCWISSQVLLCGRVELQSDVRIAASVCISDYVVIGQGASIGLGSVVTKNVEPHAKMFGVPARPLATMKSL